MSIRNTNEGGTTSTNDRVKNGCPSCNYPPIKRKMPSANDLLKFCVTYQNKDGGDSFFIQDLVEAALKEFGDFG